jgi:LysM repeat protein
VTASSPWFSTANAPTILRIMKSIHLLALPAVIALASCAAQKDTPPNPYGVADAGQINPPAATAPANPIYDTPAAYEENSAAAAAIAPGAPADPGAYNPPTAAAPPAAVAPASNGAAIIHTVVAGDTLSGLSAKYKVPIASIKAANRMTNDVVVLGRKMVIPPQ